VSGALQDNAELRVTPAGGRVVRFAVDCGEAAAPLIIPVVATGNGLAEIAARWRKGQRVHATGALRALAAAPRRDSRRGAAPLGIELVASTLDSDGPA